MTNFNSRSSQKPLRITFLCPYPFDTVGGQRFRFEQYYNYLKEHGYTLEVCSFLSYDTYSILYKKGYFFKKSIGILLGFLKRFFHLFKAQKSDFVFIYREASPIGWPIYEWIIAKFFKKKIIYDFDDAIWLSPTSTQNKIVEKLKYPYKVGLICKWSYKVSVGNSYLQAYALKYNLNSFINPTTIDTESHHNKKKDQDTDLVVIGWTGTHSTLPYLDMVYPALKKLEESYDFVFEVIADKEVHYNLKKFSFKKWNKKTEVSDLLNFNIGIMPLTNDKWSQGKCGFKALQYMSLGIPAVVSPVGVNSDIISDGVNGFLCENESEWIHKLSILIENTRLRIELGDAGIKSVNESYSLRANAQNFISFFN